MNDLIKKLTDQATKDGIEKLSVGSAIIYKKKILVLKRLPDDFMPNIYELPGGAIERNENLIDALHREVLEETGCCIETVFDHVGSMDFYSSSGLKTRRVNFLVKIKEPIQVVLSEHADYKWIYPKDASLYDITPATCSMILSAERRLHLVAG